MQEYNNIYELFILFEEIIGTDVKYFNFIYNCVSLNINEN